MYSGLAPKADISEAHQQVSIVPIADNTLCVRRQQTQELAGAEKGLWRQAGAPPRLLERHRQRSRKCERRAEAAGTKGWLQRQHPRGHCLRLFHALEFSE